MTTEWPPKAGELWMAADRWPGSEIEPPVNGGDMVMVVWGEEMVDARPSWAVWWRGEVIGPAGKRFIKAARGDLIPGDDPRICASTA